MNFCLEDGEILKYFDDSDANKTVSLASNGRATGDGGRETDRDFPARNDVKPFERGTEVLPVRPAAKSKLWIILGGGIVGFALLAGLIIYSLVAVLRGGNFGRNIEVNRNAAPPTIYPPRFPTPTPEPAPAKMNVTVQERVKGAFGTEYIKCLITNVGENVIERPSFSLTLYKNDLKLGAVYGRSELDYLKPQQTIPVWVSLSDEQNYTYAEVNKNDTLTTSARPPDKLFPQLKYVDTQMTTETGTSSYNGRLFKEKFYKVEGTVINDFYESSAPQIYVVYYDADSQIVGFASTYPPPLKKGEKGQFEVSKGEKSLFGTPQKFEIIAVDTRSK